MALGFTSIAAALDDTNGTSYSTTSENFVTGRVYYIGVMSYDAGSAQERPGVAGPSGLTWAFEDEATTGTNHIAVFRAIPGSDVSGTVTISYTNQQEGIIFDIVEVTGANTSTPTVQTISDWDSSGTSLLLTLSAFASANNHALGFMTHVANETVTHGSGFTELSDVAGFMQPPSTAGRNLQSQHKANDTTVDWSWATSGGSGGVALEIAEATATDHDVTHVAPTVTIAAGAHAASATGDYAVTHDSPVVAIAAGTHAADYEPFTAPTSGGRPGLRSGGLLRLLVSSDRIGDGRISGAGSIRGRSSSRLVLMLRRFDGGGDDLRGGGVLRKGADAPAGTAEFTISGSGRLRMAGKPTRIDTVRISGAGSIDGGGGDVDTAPATKVGGWRG